MIPPFGQTDVSDGPRTLLNPYPAVTLSVSHSSFIRLLGGNHILNDGGGVAVGTAHLADFRQQYSLDRIDGSPAINISNGSTGEPRGEFEVTGQVRLGLNSTLRLSKRYGPVGVITGDIRVREDSAVVFSKFTLKGETEDMGSVTVNGTLDCGSNQGHIGLYSSQVPENIIPNADDRANSQCNDFNGFIVLPDPPPGP